LYEQATLPLGANVESPHLRLAAGRSDYFINLESGSTGIVHIGAPPVAAGNNALQRLLIMNKPGSSRTGIPQQPIAQT